MQTDVLITAHDDTGLMFLPCSHTGQKEESAVNQICQSQHLCCCFSGFIVWFYVTHYTGLSVVVVDLVYLE